MPADTHRPIRTVRYLNFSSEKNSLLISRALVSPAMREAACLSSDTTRLKFPDKPWESEVAIHRRDGWASFTIEKETKVAISGAVAWTPRGSRRASRPLLQIRRETLGKGDPVWLARLSVPPPWFGVAIHPFFSASLIPSEIMWFGDCERAITFAVLDLAVVVDSGQ